MKTNHGLVALFAIVTIACASLYGWIMNIVTLIGMDAFSGMMVVRAIGVFIAPLGAILGYF